MSRRALSLSLGRFTSFKGNASPLAFNFVAVVSRGFDARRDFAR